MRLSVLVLTFGAVLIGMMCVFPPYIREGVSSRRHLSLDRGYSYVLKWPRTRKFNTGYSAYAVKYRINGVRLLGQIGYTLIVSICFATLFSSTSRADAEEDEKAKRLLQFQRDRLL